MFCPQTSFDLLADLGTGQEASVRGLRFFIPAHGLAAVFVPAVELEAGSEVVLEQAPFMDIELVHEGNQSGMFEAIVTEELTHVGPVLLFDVGVVVFAVGAAAGEGHPAPLSAGEVLIKGPVEELAAVVSVKAFQGEGGFGFDVFEVVANGLAALVPDGSQFGPAAIKVCKREGINKVARGRVAAMSHGIGLDVAGCGGVGRAAAGGNAMTQEGPRFGGRQAPARIPDPYRSQEPVDLGRADGQEQMPNVRIERTLELLIEAQPFG